MPENFSHYIKIITEVISSIKWPLILSALLGSFISTKFRKKATLRHYLVSAVFGVIFVLIFTEPVALWFGLSHKNSGFIAFIIGLFGMNIFSGLIVLSGHFRENPIGTINKIKRGKK